MTWRLARSLSVLRDEINTAYPNRDRTSDGTIGDPAHAGRRSDHNPDANGVVRAMDIDADLGPEGAAANLAEHLRALGEGDDPRLNQWGYVIFDARIAGGNPERGPQRWNWRPYTGPNAHRHHLHLSVGATGYDIDLPWLTKETPDMTPAQAADLARVLAAVTRLERTVTAQSADLAAVKRELTVSVPDNHPTQRVTMRWIAAHTLAVLRK